MASLQSPTGGLGGRSNARGERTRQAILDALLALVSEGDLRPTVPRVAQRAGLSLRTVFHHFRDVETLLEAALERGIDDAGPRGVRLGGLGDAARLDRFVRHRCRCFEATAAIRRAVCASNVQGERIALRLSVLTREERDEVVALFGGRLEGLPLPERAVAEGALAVAASFPSWETLRFRFGLSAEPARRAIHRSLAALLDLGVDA